MWHAVKTTVPPQSEPLALAEVKAHTYVDQPDDDTKIEMLISAVRDHVERYCNLKLVPQTVEAKCDSFSDLCWLPFGPAQSVTSIGYIDAAGEPQTVDPTVYEMCADDFDASITLLPGKSWPARLAGSRITVTAVVGYGTVPPAIKQALLLLAALGFRDREAQDVGGFSTADALLCNFRRHS